ncbi:hypothetical protein IQ457_11360 [Psychrobacter sp. M9-54-1]|uniref:hypothetical protein n=1 Tax=Psychrobacter TaxID=497 RepID=UPI00190B3BC4|nr:hypothetical protein [Psychrobacter sp. M9-54-1]MBK3394530.1 hypothetical protein [Psychrobacter sp. M9-54-1]
MIMRQKKIDSSSPPPAWMLVFGGREYEYLENVINQLVVDSDFDIMIDYTSENGQRIFHIYEPFVALNFHGFVSPSVVSLSFKDDNKVEFWFGDDNGIGMLSDRLTLKAESSLPNNPYQSIDFWHFVDNVGTLSDF